MRIRSYSTSRLGQRNIRENGFRDSGLRLYWYLRSQASFPYRHLVVYGNEWGEIYCWSKMVVLCVFGRPASRVAPNTVIF